MNKPNVLIGKKDPNKKVVFDSPSRTVYLYFGKDEGASFGAGICHIPQRSSNVRHAHNDADEIIYVLKGKLRFWFPNEEYVLTAEEAIFIPKNFEHQIFNDTDKIASHSFTFTPPGPETAIRNKYQ